MTGSPKNSIEMGFVPQALADFFREHPSLVLAFSGGVDSAYLLYAAQSCGADILPVFVKTAFQPNFEQADAEKFAKQLQVPLIIQPYDILSNAKVVQNHENRCYYCKKAMIKTIENSAKKKGYTMVIDASNASDDALDRPGMKALKEKGVRSPLREAGITKNQLRTYSKKAGLFTWEKPAYACLATRIPTGTAINEKLLYKAEWAEERLKEKGFTDFRVRLMEEGTSARIELPKAEFEKLFFSYEKIVHILCQEFNHIMLDLKPRAQSDRI